MAEQILWDEIDVDNALAEMRLDRVGLVRAVQAAEHEYSLCTANDPVGYNSYAIYAKAARGLREYFLPRGWIKDDSNNQAAIKNPETMVRILPCNFDEFAGNRIVRPTNRCPKGEVSRKKSVCNRTAWLPGIPDIEPEVNDGYITWLLGIYIDGERPTGAELSFPIAFDGKFFTAFGKRIILLEGDDEGGPVRRSFTDSDDAVEIVDITVKRK